MPKYRNAVAISLFALSAAVAQPAAAQSDCFRDVLEDCAEAMDGARWYERFALGVICSGMLALCGGAALT